MPPPRERRVAAGRRPGRPDLERDHERSHSSLLGSPRGAYRASNVSLEHGHCEGSIQPTSGPGRALRRLPRSSSVTSATICWRSESGWAGTLLAAAGRAEHRERRLCPDRPRADRPISAQPPPGMPPEAALRLYGPRPTPRGGSSTLTLPSSSLARSSAPRRRESARRTTSSPCKDSPAHSGSHCLAPFRPAEIPRMPPPTVTFFCRRPNCSPSKPGKGFLCPAVLLLLARQRLSGAF